MNPFDLRGPEFLVVYSVFAIFLLFSLSRLRRIREGTAPSALPPISDPYAIAYLRGGQKAMLEVAAFSLVDRGLLDVEDGTLRTTGRSSHDARLATDPLDREVLLFFQSKAKAVSMYRDAKFKNVSTAIEERLLRDGLLPNMDTMEARSMDFGIAVLLLVGVAAIKVIIALERGRSNIGLLIILAVIACVFTYKVSCPRITLRGKQWLQDLRTLMVPLKSRLGSVSQQLAWKETAMVAAVYGLGALPANAYPFVGKMFPAADNSSSTSSSCGSSSSSDGSSSGGSSCGGGCGGGCGGCGS
jgi:uncharacterized protein (TIGR04222 family)